MGGQNEELFAFVLTGLNMIIVSFQQAFPFSLASCFSRNYSVSPSFPLSLAI